MNLDEVEEIHDFHVWAISQGKMAMSGHIRALDPHGALKKATTILRDKYEIFHSTIQIEKVHPGVQPGCCDNDHDDHNHEVTPDGQIVVNKHDHANHNHEPHDHNHNHEHKHSEHDHEHNHKSGNHEHKHDHNGLDYP